jgi:hypothetical protein
MSIISVRAALEAKLNAMTPALSTAWENVPYTPVNGTPYAQVWLLPATPDNPTMGDGYYREQGIFQINLMYPLLAGTLTAATRAQAIRTAFKRGTSMTSGAVTVIVDRTPEIGIGRIDGDRWFLPVKIRWYAGII